MPPSTDDAGCGPGAPPESGKEGRSRRKQDCRTTLARYTGIRSGMPSGGSRACATFGAGRANQIHTPQTLMFGDNNSPPDPLSEIAEGGHQRQFPGIHQLIRASPIAERGSLTTKSGHKSSWIRPLSQPLLVVRRGEVLARPTKPRAFVHFCMKYRVDPLVLLCYL